jgi:hypothetical protein
MPAPEMPSSIKVHYIKSNLFRVVHSEGAIGGLTPSREIFVSLFNERGALPKVIEFAVSPEGNVGKEIGREGKQGIVREMEIGVLMSADAAKKLAEFLLNQVKMLHESEPEKQEESLSTREEK